MSDVSTLLGIYVCCWGLDPLVCIMVVRVIPLQTRPQAGLDPVRRHAGAHPAPRPMAFFDKVPQGRILNHFVRGISGEAQEDPLLSMLMGLFGMLVSVLLQVMVIGINIPCCCSSPLVGWALYVLQRRYRAVRLKLRRQSSVLRSPLYISISETIPQRPRPCAWPGPGASHWIRCCITMTTTCAAGTPPPPSTAGSACTRPCSPPPWWVPWR